MSSSCLPPACATATLLPGTRRVSPWNQHTSDHNTEPRATCPGHSPMGLSPVTSQLMATTRPASARVPPGRDTSCSRDLGSASAALVTETEMMVSSSSSLSSGDPTDISSSSSDTLSMSRSPIITFAFLAAGTRKGTTSVDGFLDLEDTMSLASINTWSSNCSTPSTWFEKQMNILNISDTMEHCCTCQLSPQVREVSQVSRPATCSPAPECRVLSSLPSSGNSVAVMSTCPHHHHHHHHHHHRGHVHLGGVDPAEDGVQV